MKFKENNKGLSLWDRIRSPFIPMWLAKQIFRRLREETKAREELEKKLEDMIIIRDNWKRRCLRAEGIARSPCDGCDANQDACINCQSNI
jgi:hypothetical protein